MDIAQILEELAYDTGELPREAIESAIAKREIITPHLLKILEEALVQIEEIIEQDNYQGHLYAMYLLAQFREERAYPLIIKLLSFPGDTPHAIAGDVLTEDLSRILASVSRGDILPLQKAIENPHLNEYVRGACQTSLVTLVGCRQVARDEIIAYFKTLFEYKLERFPSFVWDNLVAVCCDLHPFELHEEILEAFKEGLIDRSFICPEDVQRIFSKQKEEHLFSLFQRAELIEDTVTEMEKWISPVL